MKLQEPMKTVKALVGEQRAGQAERCCGESGTLGVARPDIATQVRFRKEEELRKDEAALRASRRRAGAQGNGEDPDPLPELPAGASRYERRPGERAARGRLHRGRDGAPASWARTGCRSTCARANAGGIERVLV